MKVFVIVSTHESGVYRCPVKVTLIFVAPCYGYIHICRDPFEVIRNGRQSRHPVKVVFLGAL